MPATNPSELYAAHLAVLDERLARALEVAGADALVVYAGEEKLVHRSDEPYPFAAEPYFMAWVPLTRTPGSILKLEPGKKPLVVYVQREDYWQESPPDPDGYWVEHCEIVVVPSPAAAREAIRPYAARAAALGDAADESLSFRSANDPRVVKYLDFHRAWKTPYEIECIREAAAIAVRGHRAVARRFGPGVSELELHFEYCRASGQRETDLPYGNIIALNEHAATLHYQNLRPGAPPVVRSLLIDAGAAWNGYACDITRTLHADTGRFAALCAAMEELQQALCDGARAGVDFIALHEDAHRRLAAVLADVGLVTASADEALAAGVTEAFLPHGLGHLLGLEVHDAGGRQIDPDGAERPPPDRHPFLRLTRVLEPGFVVTIEPGCYFIPALLRKLPERAARLLDRAAVDELVPFGGVRIEDDVAVAASGPPRNLTREAFAERAA